MLVEPLGFAFAGEQCVGLAWHAARGLDGVPEEVRRSCERYSRMIALHNVRYEAERSAVCEALRAEGLSVMPLKGSPLVARYSDYTMREVGDNDVLYGFVGECSDGRFYGGAAEDDETVARGRELVSRIMGDLGYVLVPRDDECTYASTRSPACVSSCTTRFLSAAPRSTGTTRTRGLMRGPAVVTRWPCSPS